MTVSEVCKYFDKSEIVDSQLEIDREYYSATENIYSDGIVKHHITGKAYICITSVKNASYIIFADREYNTCLCVYKHIPDITCKYIIEHLHMLQDEINKTNGYDINNDTESIIIDNHIDNNVIDINTFTCNECDSKDKLVFTRSKTNPEALETKCNNCKTEYVFVPSKYYKLSSKKIIYFKSEDSSRQINIQTPKSTMPDHFSTTSTNKTQNITTAHNGTMKISKKDVNKNG